MGKLTQIAGITTQQEKRTESNLQQIDALSQDLPSQLALQKFFDDGEHPREAERIQKNLIVLNARSWARSPSTYEAVRDTETLQKAVKIAREVLDM